MNAYQVSLPRTIYSGENALEKLREVVKAAKKVALFAGETVQRAGLIERPLAILQEEGKEVVIISDLPPEPTCDEAQRMVDAFRETGADFVLAIGGGSTMDAAKLAAMLMTEPYTVREVLENPTLPKRTIPVCTIPTTSGTGSEATPISVVSIPEQELKVGIVNMSMIPDYVILDAEMVRTLPRKVAAASGVDALAHAIECFTSNKANPFSDTYALDALDRIFRNIEKACDDPDAMEAKNQMQIAAFYAGIAITASGTTAVHALSYPLGGKYHIAHGVANAMLLMPVMRFNEPFIRDKLAMAYDRVTGGTGSATTEEEKSSWIIERMGEIVRNLDIPTGLAEFNVSEDDLEILVEAGMQVTRLLNNNMRPVTPQDARDIYLQLLRG